MARPSLILVGGGGHAASCIDVIEQEGRFDISVIVDIKANVPSVLMGYSISATDDELPQLISQYSNGLVTLGSTKTATLRMKAYAQLKACQAVLPTIISPRAHVARTAQLGEGTIIMHDALVNSQAVVGHNVIINTKALIEHDAIIGDHTHVSTMAAVNGRCRIGRGVFLGSHCVIAHDVNIADHVTVGAGSLVLKSIEEPGVYVGQPVRKIA